METQSRKESNWKILSILGLIGVASLFYAPDKWLEICIIMALSYVNNAAYSMVSRSAVRDSATYHAFTMLLSNVVWYSVLHALITDNMSLFLFVPYTVATVYGSFTGAKASMKVEKYFGITTSTEKKGPSPRSLLAKRALLTLLGVLGVAVVIYSKNLVAAIAVAGMVFVSDVAFSLLRRSRNTSNTTYHIVASLVYSAVWYALYHHLSLKGMPFNLFVPYCFGSVLGALSGQHASQWVERKIGATADAHLSADTSSLIPWKAIMVLALVVLACVALSWNPSTLILLAGLSGAQQVAFSLVSRSRNRSNMNYHIIASVFSNSIWFLTFRQLQIKNWTPELYVPYAAGGAIGSVTGVVASMAIEKKLHVTSEA